MIFHPKSIVVFTVVNTLSVGFILTSLSTSGLAESVQRRQIQRSPVQSQIKPNTNLGISPGLQGNWKGNINAQGDDVLTSVEIIVTSKSGSNYQGTWKHHGSKYNAQQDSWEDTILQQGSLKASRQGNEITLELDGFNSNKLVLAGLLTPSKISGEVVGNSHFVFSFLKQ
ncbi:hypothetical protein [Lyngbya sp. PCC 8106]|uniref:hypothetical protein n=1 Tax=Lyngbya sp. (strain PCC 8106) TaxID=313612 RepID=UPI0000EAC750|nr:hypothetical protein [Lyngbya sp. PCC 8106]EAW38604.1 hypothetical protein L8106_14355 [Lyngbya sp. PCC 8106]